MEDSLPISKVQLSVIEKSLDRLFVKLGLDINFTKHFFDRINDPRNGRQITIPELIDIYKSLYTLHGKPLSGTDDDIDNLVKSLSTDINIPLHIAYNRKTKLIDLTAVTVMRKKNFKSPDKVLAVESSIMTFKDFLKEETLNEALITFGNRAYPKFGQIVILAGGAGCFDGDTQIKTSNGYKQIRDITTSDSVYSFNETTGESEFKPVLTLFEYENSDSPIVELVFDNGEKIICTENHKFYIDGNWIEAKDLLVE